MMRISRELSVLTMDHLEEIDRYRYVYYDKVVDGDDDDRSCISGYEFDTLFASRMYL